MARLKLGLGTRLIILLLGSIALIFAIYGFVTINMHRQQLERSVVTSGLGIADTIKSTTHYDMLHARPSDTRRAADINRTIRIISAHNDIERVRFLEKGGRILFSTDDAELGELVDMSEESCVACHDGGRTREKLEGDQRVRIFRASDGHRILGLTSSIDNEHECRSCHHHAQQGEILGILDVQMSLEKTDSVIADSILGLVAALGLTMLAVILVSGLFVFFVVHRPVQKLIDGTRRVARGELKHRLDLHSSDEIGDLAAAFNTMTDDLQSARDEITNWTKTLEKRVASKSLELEQAQEGIIRFEKMASLGKLAAIVAHEINNPLMGVLTYAKLLQKRIDKRIEAVPEGQEHDFDDCIKYVGIIESEISRCGEIVKNLLVFAKQSTLQAQPNDINGLIAKSVQLVRHQMELQAIDYEERLEDALPPVVCDAGQVQQVFVALLINACEAMPDGGTIAISTELDARRDAVRIEFADTGVGMDEVTRRHLFEPFFTTKTDGTGAGLGLSVVYGIVERHGGSIDVRSSPGEGTTITIELLVKGSEEAAGVRVQHGKRPDRI